MRRTQRLLSTVPKHNVLILSKSVLNIATNHWTVRRS